MLFVKSLLVASSSSTPRTKYCTHRLKLNLRLTRCTEIRYCRTAGEVCRWADVHWSSNDTLRQVHNLLKTTLAHALQSCHVWVCQKNGVCGIYRYTPKKEPCSWEKQTSLLQIFICKTNAKRREHWHILSKRLLGSKILGRLSNSGRLSMDFSTMKRAFWIHLGIFRPFFDSPMSKLSNVFEVEQIRS